MKPKDVDDSLLLALIVVLVLWLLLVPRTADPTWLQNLIP